MRKPRQQRFDFEGIVEVLNTTDEEEIRKWVAEKDREPRGLHPTGVASLLATIDALMLEVNRGER